MKRIVSAVLACLLLCGLAACGTAKMPPPETTTTEAATTTIAPTTASPEDISKQLIDEIFLPALEMHGYLHYGALDYDFGERIEYDIGDIPWEYACVINPRFPSRAVLEASALEIFSEELTQYYLSLTLEDMIGEGNDLYDEAQREALRQLPLLMEKDGKLYTYVGSRGGNLSMESIRIESQSENKIVYALRAVSPWEGEPVIDEEYFYTRELINGKWVFTVFPIEWI